MRLTTSLHAKRLTKLALQATEREIEVKAPWGKIAALTWGNRSNPPVFLCHGRLDSCTSFRPLLHHLPEDYFYVSVDLPGNGRSDHLPKGARYMMMDFLPTLTKIKEHFDWENFIFVGHSLGAALSKYYNIVYPGHMTRIVELDPEPAYILHEDDFRDWYLSMYKQFYRDFDKYTGGPETAPKYTYEEARLRLMKARGLDEETADQILERCLEPTGDGKFRITFDQRMKLLAQMPFSVNKYKELYTASSTPTLAIFSAETVERGAYTPFPFALDANAWKNGNYSCSIVKGGHDVHIHSKEEVARLILQFLGKSVEL